MHQISKIQKSSPSSSSRRRSSVLTWNGDSRSRNHSKVKKTTYHSSKLRRRQRLVYSTLPSIPETPSNIYLLRACGNLSRQTQSRSRVFPFTTQMESVFSNGCNFNLKDCLNSVICSTLLNARKRTPKRSTGTLSECNARSKNILGSRCIKARCANATGLNPSTRIKSDILQAMQTPV